VVYPLVFKNGKTEEILYENETSWLNLQSFNGHLSGDFNNQK